MDFRTKLEIPTAEPKIDYSSKLLLLGSCFVENIGQRLAYFKFQHRLNPFGILFHPSAIHNFLQRLKEGYHYSEQDIFFNDESWKCYDAHSDLNASGKEEILKNLNEAIQGTYDFLKSATHVIITPGTSWGYKLISSGNVVANCHRVSQDNFTKELTEVKDALYGSAEIIRQINPGIKIIFTVSPVRHLKDGFVENQRSKAKLITAVHDVVSDLEACFYFPSYELMMDDLRDYRFYAKDMLHPSNVAIDYIWDKFVKTWISSDSLNVMRRVDIIQKSLAHKPFNTASQAYLQFTSDLQQKIHSIEREVPGIKF